MTQTDLAAPPVAPALPVELRDSYRVASSDEDTVALVAGRCSDGERLMFPRRAYCEKTLTPPEVEEVTGVGTVYCYTVVRTRAPYGLPTPYAVGYVDIAETGLRVFGLFDPDLTPALRPGLGVALKARPLGVDNGGQPCLRPVFCRQEDAA